MKIEYALYSYTLTTKNLGVTKFGTKSMPKLFSPKLSKIPKFCHAQNF